MACVAIAAGRGRGSRGIEPTGVDEAHEQVAGLGGIERLVAGAVFAMGDHHFESLFTAGYCSAARRVSPGWRRKRLRAAQCLSI